MNRQSQVLQLIAEGCSNREIAGSLGLTEKTVKAYVSKMFKEGGHATRLQAAVAYWKAEVARLKTTLQNE